jgi:ABC-2 type transport system permease protein
MSTFPVLLRKDLTEQWRSRRMLIVTLVFLLAGFGSPLLAKYTPEIVARFGGVQLSFPTPTAADAIDQLLKNLGQFGPFAAILLAMGAVARELERGTAAFILSKPVSRRAFLISRFLALTVTLGTAVVAASLAAYAYTAILFTSLPVGGFIAAMLLVLLAVLVYAAVTFLGSTVLDSSLPAAGIGFAVFVTTAVLSAIPHVDQFTPLGLGTPAKALALGQHPEHLLISLVTNVVVLAAALIASWLVFRSKEIVS